MLTNIRIVLVNTSHPGNIGGVARAMKNMELRRLYLLDPLRFPDSEATARASGADDLLTNAVICHSLDEALVGCHLVVGTTARTRHLSWPQLWPKVCAERVLSATQQGHEVAILFGREHSGLTNEELERCHYTVSIPCNPDFSSLNIAAAVQVISYELYCAATQPSPAPLISVSAESEEWVTHEAMENFYAHLEQTLVDVAFIEAGKPRNVIRRLRRLFSRTQLDVNEVNILRGVLTAVQQRLERVVNRER